MLWDLVGGREDHAVKIWVLGGQDNDEWIWLGERAVERVM